MGNSNETTQVAQERWDAAAEALLDWYEREASIPGHDLTTLNAEYLRRASIIDAAYEVAVEPHRQAFLADHPGTSLPPHLQPGYMSFNDQLHSKNKTVTSQKSASRWSKMTYFSRLLAVGVSIALVLVVVVGTTNLVSQFGGPTRAEKEAADKLAIENAVESVLGPNAMQKAEGFKHVGDGVLIRWATDEEKEKARENCITGLSCFVATVEMNDDCPGGIYIELKLSDRNGTVVGMANEKTPAMYKGDRGVFSITGAVKAPKAQIDKVNCY